MIDQPRGASQFQSRHTRHKRHENHRLDAPSLTTLRGLDPLLVCQLVLTPRKCGSRHSVGVNTVTTYSHGRSSDTATRSPPSIAHAHRVVDRRAFPSSTGRPGRLSSLTPSQRSPPTCRSSTNLSRSPTLSPGRLATSSPSPRDIASNVPRLSESPIPGCET